MKTGKAPGKSSRRPTMIDVARRAGVSQASVSLVLNDAGGVRVAGATRQKVRQAAEELGYRVWRRSPVGSGSIRTIGLLVDDIGSNPLSLGAVEAARARAWKDGCVLVVLPINGDKELERHAIDLLMGQRLVGIVYQSYFTQELTLPKALRTANTILLNCYTRDPNVPHIVPAHSEGARKAVAALIDAGHRRIGFINGRSEMEASRHRLEGYRKAHEDRGFRIDPALIRDGDFTIGPGERETKALMKLPDPPTAVFCASDRTAVGCYEALKSLGISVPGDVSVVGFDDDPLASIVTPPLSTVRVPHAKMGEIAVEYLLERAAGDRPAGSISSRMSCDYVARDSVAAPPVTKLRTASKAPKPHHRAGLAK
jgi:LacI family transcriptional regulator